MADVVRSVSMVLAGAAAVLLGHRALRHWWGERAGRVYELPVDRAGTAMRAGAAGAAALLAAALAVPLPGAGHVRARAGAAVATAPVAVPSPPARPPGATPTPPVPPPVLPPPPPEVHTLGHPAGGTLDQFQDGTRVWLPPHYTAPKAARTSFPVVVAHLPATADADVYGGFVLATKRGLADSFVLVLPADCARDSAAVTEAARRYRVLAARTATGVMGVGADATCAVREALATTSRYRAAVGVSGLYPPLAVSGLRPRRPGPSSLPHSSLLLATATGETAARAAALRLRDALHPHGDEVRLIDGIAAHRRRFALIAGYLTEKLDGPSRTVTPPPAPVTPAPPASHAFRTPFVPPSPHLRRGPTGWLPTTHRAATPQTTTKLVITH